MVVGVVVKESQHDVAAALLALRLIPATFSYVWVVGRRNLKQLWFQTVLNAIVRASVVKTILRVFTMTTVVLVVMGSLI